MATLSTTYLGIPVKSPIIAGACDLVSNPDNLARMEESGAGAIVYKSLFEEQIQLEDARLSNMLDSYNDRNAEMINLFPGAVYAGPEEFLGKLQAARKKVSIPLIASLNAVYEETWVKYATWLEQTGVNALELNFFNVPFHTEKKAETIENEQIAIVKKVVEAVNIPVSVKLSPDYTNLLNFLSRLSETGIRGIILFNKLFQPDIDIDKLRHISPWNLSMEKEYRLSLRYAGLLHGTTATDIIASRGIYEGEDAIRLFLAGADSIQVVSTLYRNGINQITRMNEAIADWMDRHNYASLEDFKGKLSRKNTINPLVYKRAQYIDMMLNSGKLIEHPAI